MENGDPSNDVESDEYAYIGEHSEKVTDWSKTPAVMGVREFYGGDLQGIIGIILKSWALKCCILIQSSYHQVTTNTTVRITIMWIHITERSLKTVTDCLHRGIEIIHMPQNISGV